MTAALLHAVPAVEASPRSIAVREYVAGGRVKGSVLRAHLRWAREHADPDTFRAMLDTLSPERVADLSDVLFATTWYPLQWLVDLDRAIVSAIGEGNAATLRSAGRFAAAATLRHVRASLLREEPLSFLRHVALLQSHFADFGAATWERLGTTSGRMTHRHWRCFAPTLCESSAGFYEEAARMAGGTSPNVEEISCQCRGDKHCSFIVRWR